MKIELEGLRFDFPDAIDVFKFDDEDKTSPTYHGATHAMKAVDLIVEFEKRYIFIEIKMPRNKKDYDPYPKCHHCGHREEPLRTLRTDLIKKSRDSWLYRYCEEKVDKPCYYICIINLDSALTVDISTFLSNALPIKKPKRWKRHFFEKAVAVNPTGWNHSLRHIGTCDII